MHAKENEVFLRIFTMVLIEMVLEHSQSSENCNFVMSLQYLKLEVR